MPAVLRTAHILCGGNSTEAEDLAQETMLKAFRAIEQYRDGTDARAWLLTILRHARVDRIRSQAGSAGTVCFEDLTQVPAGRPGSSEPDHQTVAENPQALLEQFTDADMITALAGLPEEIRWTLLLVDVEGIDQNEAAAILHVPVGTIKSRAHRGRMMLRGALLPLAKRARIVTDR
jgi:RNA polymerase sigma-70 factor, ECF subfamily